MNFSGTLNAATETKNISQFTRRISGPPLGLELAAASHVTFSAPCNSETKRRSADRQLLLLCAGFHCRALCYVAPVAKNRIYFCLLDLHSFLNIIVILQT